ncbi:MAG: helix-turn-helix domain-containing protein [Kiritimatiellae bacterium]|nr:helix-turn-helix domain-containing protein [Kiritimatiellia bacterium]MDD5519962.1 helix-turn-helix domain-containing protein [Kiritimatiellia bacterium]
MKKRTAQSSSKQGVRLDVIASALCGLFDFVEDMQFWIKDREGRYCKVNRGFLLNYSLERQDQVIGKTDYDLSPRHLADQYRLDDARVLAGDIIVNRIEMVGRFDHTTCWSLTNKIALRDEKGKIAGTAGITCPLKNKPVEQNWPTVALGRAIMFIREHYAEVITIRTLAKIANLSIRAFERQFQQCFRVSPQQYIKRLRVRMACHSLVYTDRPLAQIATEHGFCDQSHFTREFHRQMHLTPRHYRTRYRKVRH